MIVGLAGQARSGKDTVAKYLVEKYDFKQYALADKIREALYVLNPTILIDNNIIEWWKLTGKIPNLYEYLANVVDNVGWEKAKEQKSVRELLQRFGTEVGREMFGENFWVDCIMEQIHTENPDNAVISDIRFQNETDICTVVLKIERGMSSSVDVHKSEKLDISKEYFHSIIKNNGTIEELHTKVDKLFTQWNQR